VGQDGLELSCSDGLRSGWANRAGGAGQCFCCTHGRVKKTERPAWGKRRGKNKRKKQERKKEKEGTREFGNNFQTKYSVERKMEKSTSAHGLKEIYKRSTL
jgi:hypothetical protein